MDKYIQYQGKKYIAINRRMILKKYQIGNVDIMKLNGDKKIDLY